MRRFADALCWLVIFLCGAGMASIIVATRVHGHELHLGDQSVNYSNWTNNENRGCCNKQDCGPVKDADIRYSPQIAVRVEGKWCEVKLKHYLKKGGASNANMAHACVEPGYPTDDYGNTLPVVDPCERLLCFQPHPLF